jgi:glycosyltransferase involved in cell wall biosynthesis
MLDEMLDFFIVFQKKYSNAKFLFITPDAPELIYSAASKKGIAKENFIITSAQREEVPTLVSLCDASIFFIKQAFSKKASSPTKQGELMSMGVPLICNAGVGDTDFVVKKYEAGMVIENFTQEAYQKVVDNFDNILKMDKSKLVFGANDFYSLEKGVEKYASVYKKISEGN